MQNWKNNSYSKTEKQCWRKPKRSQVSHSLPSLNFVLHCSFYRHTITPQKYQPYVMHKSQYWVNNGNISRNYAGGGGGGGGGLTGPLWRNWNSLGSASISVAVHQLSVPASPQMSRRLQWQWRVSTNSKHWSTTSFLQPLPYLVTSQVPENCQLTSSFSLVLKQ